MYQSTVAGGQNRNQNSQFEIYIPSDWLRRTREALMLAASDGPKADWLRRAIESLVGLRLTNGRLIGLRRPNETVVPNEHNAVVKLLR